MSKISLLSYTGVYVETPNLSKSFIETVIFFAVSRVEVSGKNYIIKFKDF